MSVLRICSMAGGSCLETLQNRLMFNRWLLRAVCPLILTEVRVPHGLGRRQPLLVVVAQQLVQQVQSLWTHQVLVL